MAATKKGIDPGLYIQAVREEQRLQHLHKISDNILCVRVNTSICESCFSNCANVVADKPSLGGERGGMVMALHAAAIYNGRRERQKKNPPRLPVLPDGGPTNETGHISPSSLELQIRSETNASIRGKEAMASYTSNLRPLLSIEPYDATSDLATASCVINDNVDNDTDNESVAADDSRTDADELTGGVDWSDVGDDSDDANDDRMGVAVSSGDYAVDLLQSNKIVERANVVIKIPVSCIRRCQVSLQSEHDRVPYLILWYSPIGERVNIPITSAMHYCCTRDTLEKSALSPYHFFFQSPPAASPPYNRS